MSAADAEPVIVIGGGIAGLAAAHRLTTMGVPVTLVEGEGRLGGKILTEEHDGFVLEGGPDAFLASKPHGRELAGELGLELVGSNAQVRRAFVMRAGRLHPLPDGFTGVAPRRLRPMITTRLLSPAGKARMALEYLIPPRRGDADESLGAIVRRRAGNEAWTRLVEPLVTGVFAGDGDRLSARATFPMLPDAERRHGGFIRAGRAARKAGGDATPTALLFSTPVRGLGAMVRALEERIGADVILRGTAAEALTLRPGGVSVRLADGREMPGRAAIVATPAHAAADLIAGLDAQLAEELRAIEYVSTATVSLAVPDSAVTRPLAGHGFVLPRAEGSPLVGCTITSTKFPHRAPVGWTLARGFVGRAGQDDLGAWSDEDLVRLMRNELRRSLGVHAEPAVTRVVRWPDAIPQYNVGHLARVTRIERRVAALPAVALAGHPYRGIGIPDCIRSGQEAAAAVAGVENDGSERR